MPSAHGSDQEYRALNSCRIQSSFNLVPVAPAHQCELSSNSLRRTCGLSKWASSNYFRLAIIWGPKFRNKNWLSGMRRTVRFSFVVVFGYHQGNLPSPLPLPGQSEFHPHPCHQWSPFSLQTGFFDGSCALFYLPVPISPGTSEAKTILHVLLIRIPVSACFCPGYLFWVSRSLNLFWLSKLENRKIGETGTRHMTREEANGQH